MTEVIKRIGGFRIGTFPDFQTAAATKDGRSTSAGSRPMRR